jgi:hypothetical protein
MKLCEFKLKGFLLIAYVLKVKNLRELGIKEKQITKKKQNKQTNKIDETNKNKQQKIERAIISITTYFILSEITRVCDCILKC